MACTGRYATAEQYALFFCVTSPGETLSAAEQTQIELYLDIAASDMHSALAATGACDCTLASWAEGYLAKLNIIDAAVYHQCPCGRSNLSDDMRMAFMTWMTEQLTAIRTGQLELCQGATGSEYPAMGWGKQAITVWSQAETLLNYTKRTG